MDDPRRRYAELVGYARHAMDASFTPFAAAQKVMEFVDDEPAFADAPGVDDLWQAMLAFEAAGPPDRNAAADLDPPSSAVASGRARSRVGADQRARVVAEEVPLGSIDCDHVPDDLHVAVVTVPAIG